MDLKTLQTIIPVIPPDATEIVVKGREATEVFFTMPRDWKPVNEGALFRTSLAPNPTYFSKNGGRRWRIGT